MVSRLHRVLLRDLWHLRGQVLATAVVVGCGIGAFTAMLSTHRSLALARSQFYGAHRFGDVFAHLTRAPDAIRDALRRIPGVSAVETRVVEDVTLSVPGLAEPATGRLISLPSGTPRHEALNSLFLSAGRYPSLHRGDEAVVSRTFAQANALRLGDRLGAVLNGRWKDLTVVGLALSPEYIYEVSPTMIFPDNRRFGVLWMDGDALDSAFSMTGAFNDVSLALARGASEPGVIRTADRILAPYGGFSAYGRADQASNRFLTDELAEIEVNATYIPAVFLCVAAFILYTLLARLITIQRSPIGLLKAFGYRDARIGLHYLELAGAVALLGLAIGLALGSYFGALLVGLYRQYFHFPTLRYRMVPSIALSAAAVALLSAILGCATAVVRAVRLPPAEAMRPEAPRSYRAGLLDSLGILRRVDTTTRAILRNLARRPWRAALSATGIAAAVATVVVGRFTFDAVNDLVALHFGFSEREDVAVRFHEIRSAAVMASLRALPGVLKVEPFRTVPVLLRAGHREKRASILGISASEELHQVVDASGRRIDVPPAGLLLTRKLARMLGVRTGETLAVEQLDHQRRRFTVRVAGLSDEPLGVSGYMDANALAHLLGGAPTFTGAFLLVDRNRRSQLYRELKRTPAIAAVSIRSATLETVRDIMNRSFILMTVVMTGFGIILVVGVVYNSARIALSERGSELASLRVLGFTRFEVGKMLLGEQAVLTLLAIPAGCGLGALICRSLVPVFDRELFRLPFTLSAATFAFAALTALGAALLCGGLVAGRIARLDILAVLKSRE